MFSPVSLKGALLHNRSVTRGITDVVGLATSSTVNVALIQGEAGWRMPRVRDRERIESQARREKELRKTRDEVGRGIVVGESLSFLRRAVSALNMHTARLDCVLREMEILLLRYNLMSRASLNYRRRTATVCALKRIVKAGSRLRS